MSPVAQELLSTAYEQYLKTQDVNFSYQYKNSDELFYSITAAEQLYEDGYIDNVSDFVFSDSISLIPLRPIEFTITDSGIDFMRFQRKL